MDRRAHRLANRLVGNEDSDATLEVTLLGPEITFAGDTVVSVAGGLFDLTIDAAPVAANTRVAVRSGSVLKWGSRRQGARAYPDPQDWADHLVQLALERGSRDNVTCVVVAFLPA